MASRLVGPLRDYGADVMLSQPLPNTFDAVGFVASKAVGSRARAAPRLRDSYGIHHILELSRLVPLARRQTRGKRGSVAVGEQMQFCGESAS